MWGRRVGARLRNTPGCIVWQSTGERQGNRGTFVCFIGSSNLSYSYTKCSAGVNR